MITLFDFEDSFTYNIANELWTHFQKEVQVEPYHKIPTFQFQAGDRVILGPGPGHPREYQEVLPAIKILLEDPEVQLNGICLGHQLIWTLLGAKVDHSKNPLHGQAVKLALDPYWKSQFQTSKEVLSVQRYNSLVVERKGLDEGLLLDHHCLFLDDELMASRGPSSLSFQFHPESIGTEDSQNILGCLLS